MLILQHLSYLHPDKAPLFDNLDLTIGKADKVALIGNNGTGKSTLLKIIAGILKPSQGSVITDTAPYYIPQHFGQYNDLTVAAALKIENKLSALNNILAGEVTEHNLALLNEDWEIEERSHNALVHWELKDINLHQQMDTLSGGQKTKVFLAGIDIHKPAIVLLDEPSNHLDTSGRALLYDLIRSYTGTLVVVSHNRKLLNMLYPVYELGKDGITIYGGNYDFYTEQKRIEQEAKAQHVKSTEKALRKARETEQETIERQQKLDARGKKKQEKAGLPTISMNTLRNNAEKSTSRIKDIHADKVGSIADELNELRKELPGLEKMKLGFDNSVLHKGKVLITARDINFAYNNQLIWKEALSFQLMSGERIVLSGLNGSGKTTLIKMILGEVEPATGNIHRAINKAVYIDQEYSLVNDRLSVYEQAQTFNATLLQEHEIKIRLSWFLFDKNSWDKPCSTLSGGQKMRLALCCLTIGSQAPDIIILDEPTNNLDIHNTEILTAAITGYKGTLIVVSHDEYFLEQVNADRTIYL